MSERFADYPVMADTDIEAVPDSHMKGHVSALIDRIKRRRGNSPVREMYSAIAFHQVRMHLRGNPKPGDDLTAFVANLRDLAFALEAFNNYPANTFIDPALAEKINQQESDDE